VAGGRRAVTHYRTVEPLNGAALVECRLETGRTHQVRVHMASLGHPLLGDPAYGSRHPVTERIGFKRQALHAARLGFNHPITGATQVFESAMPADMQELFRALAV
jgi:23S rRNA pseudouridine1911/1915/1917 synthase